MIVEYILPISIVVVIGIVAGIMLTIASKVMAVEVNDCLLYTS